ncbi:hypothetical protein [Streptomyces sp. NPDC002516]
MRLDASWTDDQRGFEATCVREALDPGPHSTYWQDTDPSGPELRRAHHEMRAPTDEEAYRQAFRAMLDSTSVPAVGIALDHFCDREGLGRFCLDTGPFRSDVLARARHLLALPPVEAGVGHASALDVLARLAGPGDAGLLAVALGRRDVAPQVRTRAIRAAQDCLDRWEAPESPVVAALEEIAFDAAAAMEHRVLAIIALHGATGPRATAVFLRAARSDVLPLQVEGALGLTQDHLIDRHRDLVRTLLASWPDQDAAPRRPWLVRHGLGK